MINCQVAFKPINMNFAFFSFDYNNTFPNLFLMFFFTYGAILLFWKFVAYIYKVATTESGIHYVDHKRRCFEMNTDILNPFHFQVDNTTESFAGVKCVLKCDGTCYIQALWGVPIYSLIEYLNKDWQDLINSVTDLETSDKFNSECAHASEPFILADNEKTVEFQLPSHVDRVRVFSDTVHSRTVYPFVVLMVLTQRNEPSKYCDPYVIASVNAIHLPDKVLNKSELIVQFIRLSSGHIGQVKKIYCSSSAEERTDGLCLICYQQSATVVQLSCRHFCLCRSCYEKCDKCPLCRNAHMDFFELPINNNSDHSF